MHHRQRAVGGELDREIAIAYRIQGVLADTVEPQQPRGHGPVDGVRRPRERRCTERHAIDPATTLGEALGVALQHLEPREHVVAEGSRLRGLKMRETGKHRLGFALRDFQDGSLQRADRRSDVVERLAHEQPHIGSDLIVARPSGVQALAGIADSLGEYRFDVHVHVFERGTPLEVAGLDVGEDPLEPDDDGVAILRGQHPDLGEHCRVRDRAPDVVLRKPAIEAHRFGEPLDQRVCRLGESACPKFGGGRLVAHGVFSGNRNSGTGGKALLPTAVESRTRDEPPSRHSPLSLLKTVSPNPARSRATGDPPTAPAAR